MKKPERNSKHTFNHFVFGLTNTKNIDKFEIALFYLHFLIKISI